MIMKVDNCDQSRWTSTYIFTPLVCFVQTADSVCSAIIKKKTNAVINECGECDEESGDKSVETMVDEEEMEKRKF